MTTSNQSTEPYAWTHFVAASCPEGQLWVDEYRSHRELSEKIHRALVTLRRKDVPSGESLLESAAADLGDLDTERPSVRRVFERFYYGVLAYHRYCVDDFEGAQRFLDCAHDAVEDSLELDWFLLPLAHHCHEFRIQRVRIARVRRRWREMREHVEAIRQIMVSKMPLCIVGGVREIYISSLADFYGAMSDLTDGERESLEYVYSEDYRLRLFEQLVDGLYFFPGVVIPPS